MDKGFVVSACRFHSKEKDKLLLMGYFDNGSLGDNRLMVQLDSDELPFEIEEKERALVDQFSFEDRRITKDYYLWIGLPENWRKAKKLCLFLYAEDEKELVFELKISTLQKFQKGIAMHIDSVAAQTEGFVVKGWYINTDDVKVNFYDKDGKELMVDMKTKRRADVVRAFPENSIEEIVGFEAWYKEKTTNVIQVEFQSNTCQYSLSIRLKELLIHKITRKIARAYLKIKVYYQQYGLKATISRMLFKLSNKDSISYKLWYRKNRLTKSALDQQRSHYFAYQPKVSIVIPLYKTPKKYLDELIESVQKQTYSNWELCLSDGSGSNSPLISVLNKYEQQDSRIKVVYNEQTLQISENTNAALAIATGDYIAFADHDDLLAPNALFECVYELNKDATIDVLYTDEDKIDMNGKEHFMPHFKSDFNLDMLRSVNYICHLFVVKKGILEKVGLLKSEFDGAQDYDFVLRCVEVASNIKHIPKILYHWRAHKDSTAENPESKNYAFEAGARAIQAHYDRVGIKATVEQTVHKGIYRSKYLLQENPLISIIIPNKDHISDLDKCISSIENVSRYKNYEFIVVENNSTQQETFSYYEQLEKKCPNAKVVYWKEEGFNYPAINNFGVSHAKGEYILLLNNDTEIVNEDCLEEMLSYCMREDVGAVGARLYYEDGTIQHAGVVIGIGGIAGHTFVGQPHEALGYFGRIQMVQNYSAVTAACMMLKKSVYEEVDGFDEGYAVAFNDVDLCMKIRQAGYLIVYNPYAELNHYESKSRGYEDTEEKVQRFNAEVSLFRQRWTHLLELGDPYYNPNLTLLKSDFSLKM